MPEFSKQPDCEICGIRASFLLNKDGYDLYRCPKCLLVFVWPIPSSDFLEKKVYSAESGYQSNKTGNPDLIRKKKKTREIFQTIKQNAKGKRFLDIGCSSGEFMTLAQESGFEATGVELNARTFQVAKSLGLNVINSPIESANFALDSFDVIFMGDVIEHVPKPKELVKKCQELLSRNGLLVVVTPNLDAFWPKLTFGFYQLFKIPWSSVTPPYHLSQFSDGNLRQLVEAQGFKIIKRWFYSPPRLAYELGSLHLLKRYKAGRKIGDLLFMVWAFAIYTIAYMINWLVKPFRRKDFSMIHYYVKA